MSVYTTEEDITAFFVGVSFSTSSSPSTAQINRWNTEASAWINQKLQKKYTLPITNEVDLDVLRSIATEYTLSRVEFILGKNRVNITSKKSVIPRRPDDSAFFEKLKMIDSGELSLSTTSSQASSYSYNADNEIIPFTTLATDQW
ncbi:MAG: hypothetical protein NTV01_01795 [Bacteroidia bacterium]|nr:hypothetical protein [Bacteroidia bacterium]